MDAGPIFIAGAERSGTSLLFALLASHSSIAMTRRTNLWRYFDDQYGDLSDPSNFERCLAVMRRYKRLVVLNPDFDRLREEFWSGEPTYGRLFALLEQQYADRLGKPRWGDKSLNTEYYADRILAAYPSARILHVVRDPRDRYASVETRWDTPLAGLGGRTAEWLTSVKLGCRGVRDYPHRYRLVFYEQLVSQPENALRNICAFIGEPYEGEMLSMQGAMRFRQQGSNSSYGRRPQGAISTDSIGRFKDVLSTRQIAFIQWSVGGWMTALGYELEPLTLPAAERVQLLAASVPLEVARSAAWRVRHHYENRTGRSVPAFRLVEEAVT